MSRSWLHCLTAVVLTALPTPALAGAWSLGAHLAFSSLAAGSGGGSSTLAAAPGNVFAYQPSLRLSFGSAFRTNEAILDLGAIWFDEGGSSIALVAGTLGYQHVFLEHSFFAPFVNGGLGLVRQGGDALKTTTKSYGGGIGVRHVIGENRGTVRVEVRADFLGDNQDLGQPDLTLLTLRAGFDLWL